MRNCHPADPAKPRACLVLPLALALWASPAWGQAEAAGNQPAEGAPVATGEAVPADPAPAQQPLVGESQGTAKAAPSPGIAVLARWVRGSACRLFYRLPIDAGTRISLPDRESAAHGWHISMPHFEGAHLVMPPARSTRSAPGEQPGAAEAPTGTGAGAPAETAAEPAGEN